MAEIKVSQLPEATEINDADLFMVVQSNTNKKISKVNALATKQDTLVSGMNIKTINNTSLLGSGDINIGGTEVKNTYSTSTTDAYSCNYMNDLLNLGTPTELNVSLSTGSLSSGNLYLKKNSNGTITQIYGSLSIARDGNDRCIITASSSLRPSSEISINASVLRYANNSKNVGMFAIKIGTDGTISVDMYDGATNQNVEVYFQPFTIFIN